MCRPGSSAVVCGRERCVRGGARTNCRRRLFVSLVRRAHRWSGNRCSPAVPAEDSVRVATRSRTASKPWGGRRVQVPVEAESRPLLDDRRPGGIPIAAVAPCHNRCMLHLPICRPGDGRGEVHPNPAGRVWSRLASARVTISGRPARAPSGAVGAIRGGRARRSAIRTPPPDPRSRLE